MSIIDTIVYLKDILSDRHDTLKSLYTQYINISTSKITNTPVNSLENTDTTNKKDNKSNTINIKTILQYALIAGGTVLAVYLIYKLLSNKNRILSKKTLLRFMGPSAMDYFNQDIEWVWDDTVGDYVCRVVDDSVDGILSDNDLLGLCDDLYDWSDYTLPEWRSYWD